VPKKAKAYISCVSTAGMAAIVSSALDPPWTHDPVRYVTYFVLSLMAAALKVRLPGLTGTMSVGFVFVLLGISELTLPETMLMACTGVLVQCCWRAKQRPQAVQVIFSVSAVAISLTLAYHGMHFLQSRWPSEAAAVAAILAVVTGIYFVTNSLLVSAVLSLASGEPLGHTWQKCYLYAFPYHMAGGLIAGLMIVSGRELGWQGALLPVPVMALWFLFYRMWLERLEAGAPTS
jgi:hypothetical protein